jgi:tetratricopeptide (TPR) repeat protein
VAEPEDNSDLQFTQAEAGLAFKSEMWAMNMLLGYWKHILGVICVGLGSILVYGQYQNSVLRTQRAISADIAATLNELPGELHELPAILETGIGDVKPEAIRAVAAKLQEIAADKKGTARVEALLKAAEIYRVINDTDAQRAVLDIAAGQSKGALAYASHSALANLDLEQGNGDGAVARFEKLRADSQGFFAQQATMDLALALEHLGKHTEAQQLYSDFLTSWPESGFTEEVGRRLSTLGENDG